MKSVFADLRLFAISFIFLLGLLAPPSLLAQSASAGAETAGQDEMSRLDILKYALDSEVIALIDELIKEESAEYNEELYNLFISSKNDSVREAVLRFFASMKDPRLEEQCAEILQDPYDVKKALLSAAINYTGETGLVSLLPELRSLAASGNYDFAAPAVKAIGKTGGSDEAAFLVDLMEDELFDTEKQRLVFRQDIMAALLSLDCSEIGERLADIVDDGEENAVVRARAAEALATLKKSEDIGTIASLFNESDPVLRSAAVSAMSNFESDPAAKAIVLDAFRDSHHTVRLAALSASEKMSLAEAVPYILYRAKTDPVESVKLRAYEALGKSGGEEGFAFLSETLASEKESGRLRVKAAEVLLGFRFDLSFADVERIATAAANDSKQLWLCHELGKLIAGIETDKSAELSAVYLSASDATTKSIGLAMYERNRYASVRGMVEELAASEGAGALKRRAERILGLDEETSSKPAAGASG